jgi:hypothetical protein
LCTHQPHRSCRDVCDISVLGIIAMVVAGVIVAPVVIIVIIIIIVVKKSVALVCKRNIPTDRRRLSAKLVPTLGIKSVAWSAQRIPTAVIIIIIIIIIIITAV